MNLVWAIGIAVVATVLIMLMVRGKKTPAMATAGIFGLVVVSLMIGAWSAARNSARDRAVDQRQAAQDSASAAQRGFDAQQSQYDACVTKVHTRADIRAVLFAMVDLSDVFPGSALAGQYTTTRVALINQRYPMLDVDTECGAKPIPPATGGATP